MKKLLCFFVVAGLFYACDQLGADTYPQHTVLNAPDPFRVSLAEAQRMVGNYAPRAGYVDSGQTRPNTRAVWFSLDRLQLLLDQVEADGGDGVRIYLAAYDDDYTQSNALNAPPESMWGYNTLLLVPTRDSVAGGAVYHVDYFFPGGNTTLGDDGDDDDDDPSLIENRGNVCPPLCDDGATLIQH